MQDKLTIVQHSYYLHSGGKRAKNICPYNTGDKSTVSSTVCNDVCVL